MSSFYGTIRQGKRSRLHRLVETIPIEVQVSALASILLIAAFLSGLNWASGAGSGSAPGSPINLLANPSFGLANSGRFYVLECRGTPPCGPSESAASGWDVGDLDGGLRNLWATTDRVPSTLGDGGRWMLHVTGSGGVGIEQAGTFSVVGVEWSVWVFPVMGEVKACVGRSGHSPHDPYSCDTTTGLGFWQKLSGAYEGGPERVAADRILHRGNRDLHVDRHSICGLLCDRRVGQRRLTVLHARRSHRPRTSENKEKRMLNLRNRRMRKLGLENLALFSRCTERQLRKISVLMTDLQVPAGKVLTHAGEPGYECFVIVSGSARIVRDGATVDTLGPGSHYGEVSLLDGGPRTETVVADTDMALLVLSQNEFSSDDFLVPSVARQMLAELAARLRRTQEAQGEFSHGVDVGLSEPEDPESANRTTPEAIELVSTATQAVSRQLQSAS